MDNEEILKAAKKVSKELSEAIEKDYINKGQKVPQTIVEIIKHLKK